MTDLIHRPADLAGPATPCFPLPAAVAELGEPAARAFLDFFTARIRNRNTRAAYFRNAAAFMDWIEVRGVGLRDVQAVHVAAYVEALSEARSPATVKQHLAALRMLGQFLVVRQVLPTNPAAEVRGPAHVVRVGKTPVMAGGDAKRLIGSIDPATPAGVRDRALIGVMIYTFGRVSAVLNLDVGDYYQVGRHMKLGFREKGGRDHEMPVHHTAVDYLDAYLEALGRPDAGPLFRTVNRTRCGFTGNRLRREEAWQMVKRRCRRAGLGTKFSNHTFRATGITAYLRNDGQLEHAQFMAGHAKPETTKLYDRRQQEASLDEVERIIL
jgi:site-specific recombinase XerD